MSLVADAQADVRPVPPPAVREVSVRRLRLAVVASSLGVLIAVIGLVSATVVGSPQWSPLPSSNLRMFVGRAIHRTGSTPFRLHPALAQEGPRPVGLGRGSVVVYGLIL